MQAINDYCSVTRTATGIAQLTITNAGSLNIMNSAVMNGVREGLELLAQDRDIRALVVRGSGEKSMIGGADIKEMATLDQASAEKFITTLRDLCEAARQFPAPVIARLRGWCLGGGLEFAAACDLRIASEDAKFAMPEVKVGIPSVVEAALLPRLIGWGRTSWLLLTGDNISAAKAEARGLVEIVVPAANIDAAIEHCVNSIATEATPLAMRAQKRLMRRWERLPLDEAVQAGIDAFAQSVAEGEHLERMSAFINRKKK